MRGERRISGWRGWKSRCSGMTRSRGTPGSDGKGIPVNAGQGEISRHGCRDLVARGAVDILNVDVTIAGGVTEWRRIAGMARAFGIGMAHHEEPQISLHLLARCPTALRLKSSQTLTGTPCGTTFR